MVADTADGDDVFTLVNLPNDYDMVVRFGDDRDCGSFIRECEHVAQVLGRQLTVRHTALDQLLAVAETKQGRQHKLERFFREAYAKAFKEPALIAHAQEDATMADVSEGVMTTTLTRSEFADALGMREDDLFIRRMFACTARRHPDKITFSEFLDTVHKFANGTMEDRLRMVFDMCDLNRDGSVDRDEFCQFMRSLKMSAGVRIDGECQADLIDHVMQRAGVSPGRSRLTYGDFEAIFAEMTASRRPVGLHLRGTNQRINCVGDADSLQSFAIHDEAARSRWPVQQYRRLCAYVEDSRQHLAWLTLFFGFTALFFVERFYRGCPAITPNSADYRFENEHKDLRRVMGAGIAITRGAAGAISFCFSVVLLTVCRNLLTLLRQTFVAHYVPLDSAIVFHKIVAVTGGVFARGLNPLLPHLPVVHTVGHCINFYHVATQSRDGLQCLFREAVFSSNFQPSVGYWLYGTVTGITGILLVACMSVIYIFAVPPIVRSAYHAFRITHMLNIALYVLTVAHGLPKLLDVSQPRP